MCGIAGYFALNYRKIEDAQKRLDVMGQLLSHRGPDADGTWIHPEGYVGFSHRRLSVIDLSESAAQPMIGENGNVIVHNGEVYNYKELIDRNSGKWRFRSHSDTEAVLAGYDSSGVDICSQLRGMFAFAVWDEKHNCLFLGRDRFGIKPLYYCIVDDVFYFASEVKALLPFMPDVSTDPDALSEFLIVQFPIGNKTLFAGVNQLSPANYLLVEPKNVREVRYWDVVYDNLFEKSDAELQANLRDVIQDSISAHLVSDVALAGYVSGGLDSSLISALARGQENAPDTFYHGRFTEFPGYDESAFASEVVSEVGGHLEILDITAEDFRNNIEKVSYYLDYPVAGPGAFAQYMLSSLAAEKYKVILGGQGGDEIFAGYARYLVAYFEQCIKSAIDGEQEADKFVVTAESIIPNLRVLQEYKPMIQKFWSDGVFGPMELRYLKLIDRSLDLNDDIVPEAINRSSFLDAYKSIFNNVSNVRPSAYLDKMMHFDFKCLLPALLQVEDRMSMAVGLESRVPFVDDKVVEFMASVPALVKFKDGVPKRFLRETFASALPETIVKRRDKMGFPVPLKEWFEGPLSEWFQDTMRSQRALERPYLARKKDTGGVEHFEAFSRKTWGLLSLELWQQNFADRASEYRAMLKS